MKIEGTVVITMWEDKSPDGVVQNKTEKVKFMLEGSADAMLTALQELRRLGTFGNFDLT